MDILYGEFSKTDIYRMRQAGQETSLLQIKEAVGKDNVLDRENTIRNHNGGVTVPRRLSIAIC
jgi:hypothetical protein